MVDMKLEKPRIHVEISTIKLLIKTEEAMRFFRSQAPPEIKAQNK